MTGVPTRQLILEATITCIERFGLDKTTTRLIAQEAGANIASINYHFRTKDDLIAEALSLTLGHMLEDVSAAIAALERPLEAMIEDVFYYLIEGARRFPGVTTAHLYAPLVYKEYDSPSGQALRSVFAQMLERVVQERPDGDPTELGFVLSQIVSAILLTMLAPGYVPVAERYQPRDAEHCRALAKRYTAMLFAAWDQAAFSPE